MQGEKSKLIIWGTILFVVIVIIIISILLGNREIENELDTLHDNLTNEYYYSEVYDYNSYQSVYQAIFNYYIALNIKVALCPPNPNELERAARTFLSLALCGT